MVAFRSAFAVKTVLALLAAGAVGCSADSEDSGALPGTEPQAEEAEEAEPVEFDPGDFEDLQSEEVVRVSLAEFTVDELDISDLDRCDLAHPDSVAGMENIRSDENECSWGDAQREMSVSVTEEQPAPTAVGHVLSMAIMAGEVEHEEFMKSIAGYPAYQLVAAFADGSGGGHCRTDVAVADEQVLRVSTVAREGEGCEEANEEFATMAVEHLMERA